MRLHEGDRVTIIPVDSDPYILNFQKWATVARAVDGGYMVHLGATWPPGEEYGPIPRERLAVGWREDDGRMRS